MLDYLLTMNDELLMRAGPLGLDSGSCASVGDALEARVHMIARLAPLLEGLLAQHSQQQQQALVSALSPTHGLLQPLHSQPSSLAMSGSTSCPSPPHASTSPPAALGDRSRLLCGSDQLGQLGISASAEEADPMSTPSNEVASAWLGALAALMQSHSQNGQTQSRNATHQPSTMQGKESTSSVTAMLE